MIEGRRNIFGVELLNYRNDVVDRVAGNKPSRQFFEVAEASGEILKPFVA
jgi:hypothetical protein